jgi:predicted ester cyclase
MTRTTAHTTAPLTAEPDATRATMDAYLDDLRGGGDFARHLADDVRWTTTETGEVVSGREAVRDLVVGLHTVAFAADPEFRALHVCGDSAVLEAVFTGTHTGDFAGVPATGRTVRLPYAVAYRVADGRITELRAYVSMAALRAQVTGDLPPTPA